MDRKDAGVVPPITQTWPYGVRGFATLVVSVVVLAAVWSAMGWLVTSIEDTELGRREADSVRWLETNRTSSWTEAAQLASRPADTFIVVGLIAVAAVLLVALFRHWRPWAFLATAMLVEVLVALSSSFLVGRARPPVEQLATPPTESWPSGHVAAATTFYFALALILAANVRRRWLTVLGFAAAFFVVTVVAASRLYLGAHYPSDVLGGILLGAAALTVAGRLVKRSIEPPVPDEGHERLEA